MAYTEEELKKDVQGRFLTAPIGLKLAEMPGFISLVDGMSFTGGNDGRVLVIYDANLAKPTRYTPDDGKTWSSMEKLDFQYHYRMSRKMLKQIYYIIRITLFLERQEVVRHYLQYKSD